MRTGGETLSTGDAADRPGEEDGRDDVRCRARSRGPSSYGREASSSRSPSAKLEAAQDEEGDHLRGMLRAETCAMAAQTSILSTMLGGRPGE